MVGQISGNRIRSLRESAGMTQADLADVIARQVPGVNQSHISQVERGTSGMRAETLAVLASTLKASTDYLLGLTDNPTQPEAVTNLVAYIETDPMCREKALRILRSMETMPLALRTEFWHALDLLHLGIKAKAILFPDDLSTR